MSCDTGFGASYVGIVRSSVGHQAHGRRFGPGYLGQCFAFRGGLCFSCNWDRDKNTRGCKGSGICLQRPHERVACSGGCKSEALLGYTRRCGERYRHDVRPAVASNCSAHATSDGHGCISSG
jgi:hypothetical protein